MLVFWMVLSLPIASVLADPGHSPDPAPVIQTEKPHQVNLDGLQSTLISGFEKSASLGLCSAEIPEAARFLRDLIFYQASESYRSGQADSVWARNQGPANFFKDLATAHPELARDKLRLKELIEATDRESPAAQGPHGPSLRYSRSSRNFYEEALRITGGNVFRAVTLIANLGHDDITNLRPDSQLFGPRSIGISVPAATEARFLEAGLACIEAYQPKLPPNGAVSAVAAIANPWLAAIHPALSREEKIMLLIHAEKANQSSSCDGAGSTFNYHINFGLYVGCQLAKRGFGEAQVSKFFADATARALKDPFILDDLRRRPTGFGAGGYCYRANLATDIPKFLGYFYKRTTLERWLTDDAKTLFAAGYDHPFLHAEGKFKTFPRDWNGDRIRRAVANLDYRLMHLEYGSAQAQAGAEAGARLCRDYRDRIRPEGLSREARDLWGRGAHQASKPFAELERVPPAARSAAGRPRFENAWKELREKLAAMPDRLDYADIASANGRSVEEEILHLALDKDFSPLAYLPAQKLSFDKRRFRKPAPDKPFQPELAAFYERLPPKEFLAFARKQVLLKPGAPGALEPGELQIIFQQVAHAQPKLGPELVKLLDRPGDRAAKILIACATGEPVAASVPVILRLASEPEVPSELRDQARSVLPDILAAGIGRAEIFQLVNREIDAKAPTDEEWHRTLILLEWLAIYLSPEERQAIFGKLEEKPLTIEVGRVMLKIAPNPVAPRSLIIARRILPLLAEGGHDAIALDTAMQVLDDAKQVTPDLFPVLEKILKQTTQPRIYAHVLRMSKSPEIAVGELLTRVEKEKDPVPLIEALGRSETHVPAASRFLLEKYRAIRASNPTMGFPQLPQVSVALARLAKEKPELQRELIDGFLADSQEGGDGQRGEYLIEAMEQLGPLLRPRIREIEAAYAKTKVQAIKYQIPEGILPAIYADEPLAARPFFEGALRSYQFVPGETGELGVPAVLDSLAYGLKMLPELAIAMEGEVQSQIERARKVKDRGGEKVLRDLLVDIDELKARHAAGLPYLSAEDNRPGVR